MFFVLFTSMLIELSYFFGTYYFWTQTNTNILKLIELNNNFNDLYTFTTTDLCNQCFLVREMIYPDLEYQESKETNQIHSTRLVYFDTRYRDRLNKLKGFVANLPSLAITAQQMISDADFDTLLNGDLCRILKERNKIQVGQMSFCKSVFNGALNRGIFSAMNEFTLYLSNQKNISAIINESNQTALQKKQKDVFAYLKNRLHTDVIITDFYISECVYMIYTFISDYHSMVLYQQIEKMKVFLWVFCGGDAMLMIFISVIAWKFLCKIYRNVAWSMAIIPFEKIANDEQTIFLLKKFWNQRNRIEL